MLSRNRVEFLRIRKAIHTYDTFLSRLLLILVLFVFFPKTQAADLDLKQYTAAIHVHSTFSNGQYEIMELARLAQERSVDVLILTDSFLTTATYGIWPLDRIGFEGINKKVRPAVRDRGVDNYFAAVREARIQFPDLIILPGVEVIPYYYWKGSPWDNLTLYNFDRHLIVLGLTAEHMRQLPVIGNDTWANTPKEWTMLVIPLVLVTLGIGLFFTSRERRIRLQYYTVKRQKRLWGLAIPVVVLGLSLTWNNYPFGSLHDPYSGEHDILPYQRLIDYVREHDGVVYWSHPESLSGDVSSEGARAVRQSYPEDLLATDDYHGFEGLYGDRITVTLPGRTWDQALMQYLEGVRNSPLSVITGIDFRYFREGRSRWYDLDGGQTILLMPEQSETAVLNALQGGRNYAVFHQLDQKVRLHDFSVTTAEGLLGVQGSRLHSQGPVQVNIDLDWLKEPPEREDPFRVELIRNGSVVAGYEQLLPIQETIEQSLAPGKYYFRLRANSGRVYKLLSNPVFVEVVESVPSGVGANSVQ